MITDASKLEYRPAAELKAKYGVDLRTGVEVTSVDVEAKTVTIGGGETVKYENLVLASGGVPRRLPVEGGDLGNVFTLRGVADAKSISDCTCSSSLPVHSFEFLTSLTFLCAHSDEQP